MVAVTEASSGMPADLEDGRVDGHDVGHREEGGQAGNYFAPDGRLLLRKLEELIEPAIQFALQMRDAEVSGTLQK